jgi:hypothetical protein
MQDLKTIGHRTTPSGIKVTRAERKIGKTPLIVATTFSPQYKMFGKYDTQKPTK